MKYKVLALDGKTVIIEANTYNDMWRQLVDFKGTQLDENIDGMTVHNTVTQQWDYAWRVALNMQDLRI